jgi:hypothetical protein
MVVAIQIKKKAKEIFISTQGSKDDEFGQLIDANQPL